MSTSHAMRSGSARLHRCSGAVSLAGRAVLAMCLLVLAIGVAAVSAHSSGFPRQIEETRCIHDELQQRVLQSLALHSDAAALLSPMGLPYVVSSPQMPAGVDGIADADAPTDSSPDVTRADTWGDLRVKVSLADLDDPNFHCTFSGQQINNHLGGVYVCYPEDVLTAEKRDILVNYILREALKMHTDRLKVRQVQNPWKVSGMFGATCGDFKVPTEHTTDGLNDTDFVLYVTSVPTPSRVVAWATSCQVFTDDHPAVGVINIPSAEVTSRYDQQMIHTVAHEIAHALGFSAWVFNYRNMTHNVTGLRGRPYPVLTINTSNVVARTREHYSCDTAEFMELEDQGGGITANSHWKMRNAYDELMGPLVSSSGYYSNMTLAAFEDMGFYKPDYSKAEPMLWGNNSGCDLINEKCMEDNITQWPEMFCNIEEWAALRCTSGRIYLGTCTFGIGEALPDYFQYFTVKDIGGFSILADWCPYVTPWYFGPCKVSRSEYLDNFNVFSDASRCIDADYRPTNTSDGAETYAGMCANIACDNDNQAYRVQVAGYDEYLNCTPGATIDIGSLSDAFEDGSYITCPPYVEVCTSNIKAAMDYDALINGGGSSSASSEAAATTTTTSTSTPTTSPAPIASSSSAAASSSGADASTTTTTAAPATTTTAAPATNTTTTTATPRGNAAASLCSPRAVTVALLTLLLAAICA